MCLLYLLLTAADVHDLVWGHRTGFSLAFLEGISKMNGSLQVSLRIAASAAMRTISGVGSRSVTATRSSL